MKRIILMVGSMHSGGAERVAATLANEWVRHGVEVTLMVTYSGRGSCFYEIDTRVNLLYLSDISNVFNRSLVGYAKRLWALRMFIHKGSPDVIIAFLTNVNVLALLASFGMKVPVIVSERTYPPMLPVGKLWHVLRRVTYPWSHRVVMLTDDGLKWLKNKIPSARGVVIPNPVVLPLPVVDPVLELSLFVEEGRFFVLAVGRLDSGKQFNLLITAFAGLAAQFADWDLVILGEGPDREKLERQVQSLGLGNRVKLPGRAGNVGQWYERADLFVLSSQYEGFPNVLVEAMAHGCAVISYDCDTGPRDIIRQGIDGLLVSPVGDVSALEAAIAKLMSDTPLRKEIEFEAKRIAAKFSVDEVIARWSKAL